MHSGRSVARATSLLFPAGLFLAHLYPRLPFSISAFHLAIKRDFTIGRFMAQRARLRLLRGAHGFEAPWAAAFCPMLERS
jgi:hypothetical protein